MTDRQIEVYAACRVALVAYPGARIRTELLPVVEHGFRRERLTVTVEEVVGSRAVISRTRLHDLPVEVVVDPDWGYHLSPMDPVAFATFVLDEFERLRMLA